MFNVKFLVGSIITTLWLTASGCSTPVGAGFPSPTPTISSSQAPSPSPSPSVPANIKSEADKHYESKKLITATIVSKAMGPTAEGPRFTETTVSEGAVIDDGKQAIVWLPKGATTAKKVETDQNVKLSDKAMPIADALTLATVTGSNLVRGFENGSTVGKLAVISGQQYKDLSSWYATGKLYNIMKGELKIGEIKVNSITNIFTGSKALEIVYSLLEDVRIEVGITPVYLSKTSKEAPTKTTKLEKVAKVDPVLGFGDDKSLQLENGGKFFTTVEVLDVNWDQVLISIEQMGKEVKK